MSGKLPTHTQRNGQMLIKVVIVLIAIAFSLCSCSVDWWIGDGRGDWERELFNGYSIVKVNSRNIHLCKVQILKDGITKNFHEIIPGFFVQNYQLHEPYICLKGVYKQAEVTSGTQEELNSLVPVYYLVDTNTGEVMGPFNNYDEFVGICNLLSIEILSTWIETQKS